MDNVADEEVLYRCVFYGKNNYKIDENNEIRVSSQAFTDRNQRPSVDRASLCNNNPKYSQKDSKDGVVSLITRDVRLIDTVIQNDKKGKEEFTYKIDVKSRPLDENHAHAQIEPNPEYRNKTPFRKLLERLAYLANQRGWEIPPSRD
ncbi:MAG: hypothetical protein DSM107014_11120 [Gomphosphaeria aponina SAG 52.96 = DSM 107014]|uniref:Uncharacterized protein n=1 Tax=Gomphosphaeria aponina SAG 52.96 = DSM 107014 TaxID=1521640 RepID=A0A941JV76_9CHRO|nr:hypothetical protein [Gomphosphaeria aponina SAG 52.96 = DSM 107014]